VLSGDTSAFFKAVEIIHGKPRQTVEQNLTGRLSSAGRVTQKDESKRAETDFQLSAGARKTKVEFSGRGPTPASMAGTCSPVEARTPGDRRM
jgi:hypothetical protein